MNPKLQTLRFETILMSKLWVSILDQQGAFAYREDQSKARDCY